MSQFSTENQPENNGRKHKNETLSSYIKESLMDYVLMEDDRGEKVRVRRGHKIALEYIRACELGLQEGNFKAYESLRDTIGEKPKDKSEITQSTDITFVQSHPEESEV